VVLIFVVPPAPSARAVTPSVTAVSTDVLRHRFPPLPAERAKNVKTREAVGISPRPDWTKVHQRLVDFLRLKSPSRDKLIAAIAEGDGDIAALRAHAYAEATVGPLTARLSPVCTTNSCSSTPATPARITRNLPTSSKLPQRNSPP
jgi:hypothetical protein